MQSMVYQKLIRQSNNSNQAVEAAKRSENVNNLDRLLWIEEQRTGKRVYKRGSELRHGLLDVQGICENIMPANNKNSLNEKS